MKSFDEFNESEQLDEASKKFDAVLKDLKAFAKKHGVIEVLDAQPDNTAILPQIAIGTTERSPNGLLTIPIKG